MKFYISFLILFTVSLSAYAQFDNENNGFAIPAEETMDPKDDPELIYEPIPEEAKNLNQNKSIAPKAKKPIIKPKKEFSMIEENNFRNPAELFEKRLNKQLKFVEDNQISNGSRVNIFLGKYKTSAKKLNILYRDYGSQDGDLIKIYINGEVIIEKQVLTNRFKGINFDFKQGEIRIEFEALNEGAAAPNTAELKIYDENKNIVTSKEWALKKGKKAIIVLSKSDEDKFNLIGQKHE